PLNEADSTLAMGHVQRQQVHLEKAQDAYLKAQYLYRTLQNAQGLGHTALALGHVALQRGHTADATEQYQEALRAFHMVHDPLNEADASRSLGDVQRLAQQFAEAEAGYIYALEVYRAHQKHFSIIDTLTGLGRL